MTAGPNLQSFIWLLLEPKFVVVLITASTFAFQTSSNQINNCKSKEAKTPEAWGRRKGKDIFLISVCLVSLVILVS